MVTRGASLGATPPLFIILLSVGAINSPSLPSVDAREEVSCEKSRQGSVNMGNHQDRNLLPSDKIARHRELTAHARARYRCFLPDLAGLARVRRVRPMPDLNHSSIEKLVLGVAPASRRLSRGRLAVA